MAVVVDLTMDDIDLVTQMVSIKPARKIHSHPAVYALHHEKTGQTYVGSTKNLYHRVNQHKTRLAAGEHKNHKLQSAFDDDPKFNLSFTATDTKEQAIVLEQGLLDKFILTGTLLNLATDAANAAKGLTHSDSVKDKLRQGTLAQFSTEEARARHSEISRDLWQDPQYRQKQMGHSKSAEVVQQISDKVKALWEDPEYRAKMTAHRGKPVTVDGIAYTSLAEASRTLGIPKTTIGSRLKRNLQKSK